MISGDFELKSGRDVHKGVERKRRVEGVTGKGQGITVNNIEKRRETEIRISGNRPEFLVQVKRAKIRGTYTETEKWSCRGISKVTPS